MGENYKGLGLGGSFGGRFKAEWDLYGGGTELKEDVVPEDFLLGTPAAPGEGTELEVARNVVGGHLVIETPLDGLSFGGSVLTGTEDLEGVTGAATSTESKANTPTTPSRCAASTCTKKSRTISTPPAPTSRFPIA